MRGSTTEFFFFLGVVFFLLPHLNYWLFLRVGKDGSYFHSSAGVNALQTNRVIITELQEVGGDPVLRKGRHQGAKT